MNILLGVYQSALAGRIKANLEKESYSVISCQNQSEIIARFTPLLFDFVILDVTAEQKETEQMIHSIRKNDKHLKIVIVISQAVSTIPERIWQVVDDYIKLHELDELILRLRLLKKRIAPVKTESRFNHNGYVFNDDLSSLTYQHRTLSLTKTERKILFELFRTKNTVAQDYLIDRIWQDYMIVDFSRLKFHVSALRAKIRTLSDVPLIATVRGKGYRLS